MVEVITVDKGLADEVEAELYSPLKPQWGYYNMTTEFYHKNANDQQRAVIDKHSQAYGPVIDTQRFTFPIYSRLPEPNNQQSFFQIRSNPNSLYRKRFKFLPDLIDHLQGNYIPPRYIVDRFIVNMQLIRPQWSMNAIHPDTRVPGALTILYYVNNSDGDTFFFDDDTCIKRVPPIKGTAAIYPSSTYHAGSTPVQHETRTVVNIVFVPKN
jgi:hypothetical protein